MKEKHRVMAGLVPKPTRKSPIPIISGESARQVKRTDRVPTPQAIRIANLLPKLSAMNGITKNPKMAPTNIISCSIATVFY
jgi:hypothetical protein